MIKIQDCLLFRCLVMIRNGFFGIEIKCFQDFSSHTTSFAQPTQHVLLEHSQILVLSSREFTSKVIFVTELANYVML